MRKAGGHTGDVTEVDGRLTLPFEDGEGQRLVLVDDGGAGPASPWEKSSVPAEHQIRGLGPIVLTVQDPSRTAAVLTDVMNMRKRARLCQRMRACRSMCLRWARAVWPPNCM